MATRLLCAAAMALGMIGAPLLAQASVIQLGVTGLGLDQGDLCATTNTVACPASPTLTLASGTTPTASGSFSYNTVADTVNFTLTLTQSASFGSETLLAGSTFSGSAVPVTLSPLGKSSEEITQNPGAINGTASWSFSPSLTPILSTPAISALSCTLGSKVDVCGVSLGAGGLEAGPDAGGTSYNAFLTFNVDVIPVPLPASAWLLLSGVGGILLRGRGARTRSPVHG